MTLSLTLLRVAAVLAAAVTLFLLIVGDHPTEFVVADIVVVAALLIAAALPGARALPWLVVAFAFAAGVFTVATVRVIDQGRPFIPLAAGALLSAAALVLGALNLRPRAVAG